MRRDNLLAGLELLIGLGMLLGFLVVLVVPGAVRLALELPWALGAPLTPPGFGLNPHRFAEARYVPSLVALTGCAVLALCYRWLTSRRRE
jgi:uncharacterized BrkB/YihY/UPF0761 family membrane protein